MMQLSSVLVMFVTMFASIGFLRGWTREIVATAGIVLALFTQQQFSSIIFDPLTAGSGPEPRFYLYGGILAIITFFAYQTPHHAARLSEGRLWSSRRDNLQERLLGTLLGGINGYLVFGSLWYYLDVLNYPFYPYFIAPSLNSPSAQLISSGLLPLTWLVQGNLLTFAVIVLFLFVIVAMI